MSLLLLLQSSEAVDAKKVMFMRAAETSLRERSVDMSSSKEVCAVVIRKGWKARAAMYRVCMARIW